MGTPGGALATGGREEAVRETRRRTHGVGPHLVPPLFEEIARILHDVGNDAAALRFFGRAREIERAHDIPVYPDRHRAVFTEFSSLGIVGARAMTAEAGAAVRRFTDPRDAFDHLLDLNTARIAAAGQPPTPISPAISATSAPPRGLTPTGWMSCCSGTWSGSRPCVGRRRSSSTPYGTP
ncbi:hypothetical protein JIM95_009790 [Corynebacterium sp. CCM 8835]|uniref:Bacterial transcriptional activator domain-containing protein n=1 Tax=Corynebacterium antarcticum TaxID=2800405 RepID=A0ABS1FJ51_9CORY|nr:hypothetical protein [Corynebacterium antarcticum]MCK7643417.1 hypothetical protein [Corynebacterium antarcticum]MCL0246421.1 hypothetical protein [Corynebacterium antarcticum]MCX7541263.1 hypothetical protein [Corynebacterium antarcticum]